MAEGGGFEDLEYLELGQQCSVNTPTTQVKQFKSWGSQS